MTDKEDLSMSTEPIDLQRFLTEPDPEGQGWAVVSQMVVRGLTLIRGTAENPAILALNLALRRAAGLPWLDQPVRPGKTLYLDAANPRGRVHWLVQRQLDELGPPPSAAALASLAVLVAPVKFDEPAGFAAIEQHLATTEADLLIVDNATRTCSDSPRKFLAAVDRLLHARPALSMVLVDTGDSMVLADGAERVLSLERASDRGWYLVVSRRTNFLKRLTLERNGTAAFQSVPPPRLMTHPAPTPHVRGPREETPHGTAT